MALGTPHGGAVGVVRDGDAAAPAGTEQVQAGGGAASLHEEGPLVHLVLLLLLLSAAGLPLVALGNLALHSYSSLLSGARVAVGRVPLVGAPEETAQV